MIIHKENPLANASGFSFILFRISLFASYYLIHLLCREARLCDNVALGLRETIIQNIIVTNADYVAKLVPELIGVKAI